jgi:lysophospholipase
VLILPGRTECVEKYGRAAADLGRRGYASVTVDWRGQGLSDRVTDRPMLGHIARFTDYQRDLRAILAALPALGLPDRHFMLAHSMGGTIGLRALVDGIPFRAAAFTAPMWGIHIAPSLRPLAWALASGARAAGRGQMLVPSTNLTCYLTIAPFDGNLLTTDAEMFAWMKSHVIERPELALGGPTLHWLHEALLECRRLRAAPSPDTPALTFLGERERIVAVEAIEQRMARWPNGTLDRVRHAEHEVLMETPAIRTRAFDQITALFDQHR